MKSPTSHTGVMSLNTLMLCIFQLIWIVVALPQQQEFLGTGDSSSAGILDIRYELIKAEIIPTVLDDFYPSVFINVSWPTKKIADLGNTIKPKKLQDEPHITLIDMTHHLSSDLTYTIAMTDPDAPSRDNPEWSEMCHWIATNISLKSTSQTKHKLDSIVDYKPPGPPAKTGKHRYVIIAFAPANQTTEPLHLIKPRDRQHWGFDQERMGARDWANLNGLVPVGANFIYAQNKKQ